MSQPRQAYQAARDAAEGTIAELETRMRSVEVARVITFVVGSILGLLRNDLSVPPVLPGGVATVALIAFVFLVVHHRRLKRLLTRARAARALAVMGLRRLERDWDGLHEAFEDAGYADPLLEPMGVSAEPHPYLVDLDIFGPASVRALLGPTPSPTGVKTLRSWLEGPAAPDVVRARQQSVASLASDFAGREQLAIEALLVDQVGQARWLRFVEWVKQPALFDGSGESGLPTLPAWSVPLARTMPPVTLVLFGAWAVGWLGPSWPWFIPLAVQSVLAWRWGQRLNGYFDAASSRSPGVRRYHALFAAWEEYPTTEDGVSALQSRLSDGGGHRASESIRTLERWLDAADSRASMLHVLVAAGLLWDVHVAAGLEGWRQGPGQHIEDWFDALGELEALSALAALAHDEPEWSFPELRDEPAGLEAEALGHPLLSGEERRTSDLSLDPPGRFLLVTGSNMSGKSTLLRSIGLAAVLGQAGSVVCARRVSMSPLRTFSSMRIHDSLTGGVSLFMAELLRLKALVDASEAAPGAPALLYLIDEVLQGTNSEERRVAARRIVRHLLASHAVGAVTTHDLALHDDPTLDPNSTKVHFREHVDDTSDRVLTFDYVLRPGLATSRNALKLLKIVGLPEE